MRSALRIALVASLALAVTPVIASAASFPEIGRYKGQTGDGHVFQFNVERSKKPNSPRKITHIWLVYDIANCRSGPIRQPFFASVFKTPASPHGAFSRTIPKTDGQANHCFFDGHVELMGDLESANPVLWAPKGTQMLVDATQSEQDVLNTYGSGTRVLNE